MITAFRQKVTVKDGGVVSVRSRRLKPGSMAEVIILVQAGKRNQTKPLTANDLLKSGLVGMWAGRKDLGNSLDFARSLRSQAEKRGLSQ
jgi:hypothetical protein